jgi:hypothetical protein
MKLTNKDRQLTKYNQTMLKNSYQRLWSDKLIHRDLVLFRDKNLIQIIDVIKSCLCNTISNTISESKMLRNAMWQQTVALPGVKKNLYIKLVYGILQDFIEINMRKI